jgi:hypothetical protein
MDLGKFTMSERNAILKLFMPETLMSSEIKLDFLQTKYCIKALLATAPNLKIH